MRIIQAVSEWLDVKYQENVSQAQSSTGVCSACLGNGINMYGSTHFYTSSFYSNSFHCSQCNGNGFYSNWDEIQH